MYTEDAIHLIAQIAAILSTSSSAESKLAQIRYLVGNEPTHD